jgi:hypothetical protein
MKSLRHYLTESTRTYHYTIKILGDVDKNFLQLFTHNLSKFDPVKIEDPKTTPIQKNPYGFTDAEPNQSVTIIKAEFRYPATEPMIQQLAQQQGFNINRIRALTTDFNDSLNAENDKYANEMDSEEKKALLTQEVMADNGKQAGEDYAKQYLDKVVPTKPSIDYAFAGKSTAKDVNKTKEGIQTSSPFSKINMPPRPTTGASL